MCTRYSFTVEKEIIEQQFGLNIDAVLKFSYNLSATQQAYVLTNESPRRLTYMIWGLIPNWSNDGFNNGKLINARVEGIETSTSFRIPIRKRRCLILADSYYVWKQEGSKKRPYRVILPGKRLMAMAGVWDTWDVGGKNVKSFSIITRPATKTIKNFNDRMPLILDSIDHQQSWLENINLEEIMKIATEAIVEQIACYPISHKVNIIGFNSKELHEELAS